MFGNAFGWPHLIIILAIVLLLFGAPKLPALAKSIAQSMKIFRTEVKTGDAAEGTTNAATAAAPPATPAAPAAPAVAPDADPKP